MNVEQAWKHEKNGEFKSDIEVDRTARVHRARLGVYLSLIGGFLLFMLLIISQPTTEAWTSSNTGKVYTLKDIYDEVGNNSVVEPLGLGTYIVKEEIVIQNNDTLLMEDNVVYSNSDCQFVILGRCAVDNSTLKQNFTDSNWLGILVYEDAIVSISRSKIENASVGVNVGLSLPNNMGNGGVAEAQIWVNTTVFKYCDYAIYGTNAYIELVNVDIRNSEFYGIYAENSYLSIGGLSQIHDNGIGIHLRNCLFSVPVASFGLRIYNNGLGVDLYEQDLSLSTTNPMLIYQNGIGIRCIGGSLSIENMVFNSNTNTIVVESCFVSLRNVQILNCENGISATNAICNIYNSEITNVGKDGIIYADTQGGIFSSQMSGSLSGNGITAYSCSPIISDCKIVNFSCAILLINSDAGIIRTQILDCEIGFGMLSSKPKIIECAIDTTIYLGYAQSSEVYFEKVKASTKMGFNCSYFSTVYVTNSTLTGEIISFVLYYDSHVTLLNTTYEGAVIAYDDYSRLVQQWYAHVRVVDALGNPMPGMQVIAKDGNGENAFYTITGADGTSYWNICTGLVVSRYLIDTSMSKYNFTTFLGTSYAYTTENMIVSKNIVIVFNQPPTIVSSIPDIHIPEDSMLCNTTLRLGDYFSDIGPITYTFAYPYNLSSYVTLLDVNGYIWAKTNIENWFGTVFVTVRATDNLGAFVETNFNLIVEPVNDEPKIQPISNVSAVEDIPYILDLSSYISDVDTPISQLIITENSSYVTVSGLLLILNYPEGILYDLIELKVCDGHLSTIQTFAVMVQPVNDAPVILPIPAQFFFEDFDGIIFYEEYIYDVDNPLDSLILSVDSIYVEIEYDEYELEFDYPNGITYERVKLTVSDGLAFSETFIDVYITPVNDAPELAYIPTIFAREDVPITIDLSPYITDVDNHISELTIYDNSPYTTFEMYFITLLYPNGVLSDTINVTVFDGEYSVSRSIQVIITPVNDAPRFLSVPNIFALEDVPYVLNLTSYILDEDNSLEEISVLVSSPYALIQGKCVIFTYPDGVIYDRVTITVSDGELSSSIELFATVTPVNDAPMIIGNITVNAIEDVPYYLDISNKVIDVDTPFAQLKLFVDSPYASVLGMKVILCYPNGVYSDVFNVTVTDGLGASSTKVYVNVLPVNDAPEFKILPSLTLVEDIEYTFDLSSYIIDVDSNLSSISIKSISSNYALVDGLMIRFTYPNGVTHENVIITITDGTFSAVAEIQIRIEPVNDAPVISEISQINAVEDEETIIDLSQYIHDEDNLISDLTIYTLSPYARVLGSLLYLKFPNGVNLQKINITVSDGKLSATREFMVSVSAVNDPPVISDLKVIPPTNGDASERYIFSVIYTDEENQAPNSIVISIDGNVYDLIAVDLSDVNYSDGKGYMLEIKLKKGMHTYHVEVEDEGGNKGMTPSLSFYVSGENKQISELASNTASNFYILTALLLVVALLCCVILLLVLKMYTAKPLEYLQLQNTKTSEFTNKEKCIQNEKIQNIQRQSAFEEDNTSDEDETTAVGSETQAKTNSNDEQNNNMQNKRNIRLQGKSGSAEIELETVRKR